MSDENKLIENKYQFFKSLIIVKKMIKKTF